MKLPGTSLSVDGPRVALSVSEQVIHVGIPAFILIALRSHYSPFFFWGSALAIIGYVLYWRYRRQEARSYHRHLAAILPLVVGVAYLDVIWRLYNVGQPQVYPDTLHGYLPSSELSIFSLDFWFLGVKPFVTPLIFKLCRGDLSYVNDFFVTGYLLVTLFTSITISSLFSAFVDKVFVFYLFTLFFLNQSLMGAWLTIAQSEVPAILATTVMVGLFAYSYQKRESLNRDAKNAGWLILAIIVTTLLFSFSRDTNMYFLPFLILFYFLVFERREHRIIVTVAISLIFLLHNITMERSGRWKFPLANIVMQRIIPDEGLRKTFQEKYHLPADRLIEPATNRRASEEFENKELIFSSDDGKDDWVSQYGLKAYKNFLMTHPRYVFSRWVQRWRAYNANFWQWSLRKRSRYRLNEIIFFFPGRISFSGAVLILLGGLLLMKENPLISLTVLHSMVIGMVAYHGDAMEVERHLQQAAMTLRFSFLILLVVLYKIIRTHLEQMETA